MNILILDDDILTLTALEHLLSDLGHQPIIAEDTNQAITRITNKEADLVISDIMMPGLSGLALVNVLRSVHKSETPIIMMSSLHNSPLVAAALKAGANDFIDKPITIEALAAKINKFDTLKQ